jgi:hypothetical protein
MLELMEIKEVGWYSSGGGTELAGDYVFFYRKGNDNFESSIVFGA